MRLYFMMSRYQAFSLTFFHILLFLFYAKYPKEATVWELFSHSHLLEIWFSGIRGMMLFSNDALSEFFFSSLIVADDSGWRHDLNNHRESETDVTSRIISFPQFQITAIIFFSVRQQLPQVSFFSLLNSLRNVWRNVHHVQMNVEQCVCFL